ncbi:MAG: gliding motility-associated C-terminal domain-containing protein [Sphingobacteriales bacterium]|nr:MAG: gliding motility-associated C-terminal domain-containing protein [Sphingobacteriales bacterium]
MGLSITLTEPAGMTLTETHTDALCFGGLTGAIDLSVSSGTAPYTYSWNTGAASEDINGLGAGDYDVTVTDANGCTMGLSITLTEPVGMTLTETHTDVLCFGGLTGAIDLSVLGGTVPYTYSWNTGAVSEDINGLGAGDYDVTVTDANGCTMGLSITLTEPAGMTLTETHTDVLCFGGLTGAIDLSVSGGTVPYTYSWNTGAVSEDLNGLGAGDFDVIVTDAIGCSMGLSITLTEPAGMTLTETHTDVLCFGGLTGAIDLSVSGGTVPFTYSWNTGAISEDINGLEAGNYDVTVTDANGCTNGLSIEIIESSALILSLIPTDASCGVSNGAVTSSVSGGTGTYTYLWSTGAVDTDITGLSLGTYTVTVSDGAGCTASDSVTIDVIGGLTLTLTSTDASCGNANGAVISSVSGGTGTYTYLWSNGAIDTDLTGLGSGSYTVTVTDSAGCTSSASATVGDTGAISLTLTPTDANCGDANGAVSSSVSGGTGTFTYLWSNGAIDTDLTGLGSGTYTVTVTDGLGCTASASATVGDTGALSLTLTPTDANCGDANGAVTSSVSGGTGTYTYQWSNGAVDADITGLGSGGYTVTVTDGLGCTTSATVSVGDTGGLTLNLSASDASCGDANGAVTSSVSGGTGTYTYLWSNGAIDADISGLSSGTYSVTITDGAGCTVSAIAAVGDSVPLTLTLTQTDANCGDANGAVTSSVSGGTGTYTYLWSNGAINTDITGLGSGTYSVTITDGAGCTASASAVVEDSVPLTLTLTPTDANCGDANGAVVSSVSGGTGTYSYLWSNGAIDADITALNAGSYTVTITDDLGCTASASAAVANLGGPVVSAIVAEATCGNDNGSIDLTVSGGTGGYTFIWSNAAITEDINLLAPGSYSVTVTDNSGCEAFFNATVTVPSDLLISETHTDVSCFAGFNGSIDITVSGGSGNYTYEWSNGITSEDLNIASEGDYSVTVTDSNNCTVSLDITISEPTAVTLSETHNNAFCAGSFNGNIDLTVSGGTGSYNYVWSNGSFTQDISGLALGTYSVTVSDANNCTSGLSIFISNAGSPVLNAVTSDATCGNSDGNVDVSVTGGTLPYSYIWDNGAVTQDLTNIPAGTYSVTVTDANGCTDILTSAVSNIGGPIVSTDLVVNTSCEQPNGSIDISVNGGTAPYTYLWSNLEISEDLTGLFSGTYTVTVTDANDCIATLAVIVNNQASPTLSAVVMDASCGQANGAINLTVTGTGAPYTFLWSDGSSDEDLNNVIAGTYTVTVTDVIGCTAVLSQTINDLPPHTLNLVATVSTCSQANGSVVLTVSGGQMPFTYLWSNGAITQDLNDVLAGNYSVTVTDITGCEAVGVISVGNAPEPSLLVTNITHATCGLPNGSITVSASGGVGVYSYSWSHDSALTGNIATGLAPGSYLIAVSDENNCVAVQTVVINNTSVPSIQVQTVVHTSCELDNGSISLSTSGGVGSMIYTWSHDTGLFTGTASGLAPGIYSATVTDFNNCTDTISVAINPSSNPDLSLAVTDATCGNSNGAIDITIANGVAPYTFSWNNGSTDEDLTNIPAGNYTVTVTDTNSCSSTMNVSVGDSLAPDLSVTIVDATCGYANGAIDLFVSGGLVPYTFSWSNGSTDEDLTNLLSGFYEVTVTDANGCTAMLSATVGDSDTPVLSVIVTDDTCGNALGTIDLSISGGLAPFTFLWSNGSTDEDLSNLLSGDYEVTVTDANGCTDFISATVNDNAAPALSYTVTDVTCGNNDGSIDLTVSGGLSPYTFVWSNGNTDEDIFNLPVGDYNVTVTDANGCTVSTSISVNDSSSPALSVVVTDATCGNPNGAIDLTVNGGVSPYSFSWNNGMTDEDITNLLSGDYEVTVTDANGCTAIISATVGDSVVADLSVIVTDVTCGNTDGAIDLIVSGGLAPYTYNWSNGMTGEDVTNLPTGDYEVTVTDSNGCISTIAATVSDSLAPGLSVAITNATCANANGAIDLSVSGGFAPYTYNWSNGMTGEDLTNLLAGDYAVTVTDANGCTSTITATVGDSLAPGLSVAITDATCANANGAIDLTVSGGLAPYTYSWSNGITDEDLANLIAGDYAVTVTDANGCTSTMTATVGDSLAPGLSLVITDATCANANGAIDLTISGGLAPYTYSWSNGMTDEDLTDLHSGDYDVTVTDANGCTSTITATVGDSLAPGLNIAVSHATCDDANGAVDLTVSGGLAPYTFSWNNGITDEDLTNLFAGAYDVTVTDANGCTSTITATVGDSLAPGLSVTVTDATCANANGAIDLTVSGGLAPYTYSWSNGSIDEDLTNLLAGDYAVTVTDANGCTATLTATVSDSLAPGLSVFVTDATCANANGAIDLTVSGGLAPYIYSWSNGMTGEDLTNIPAGDYTVTVTDANGCTSTMTATVSDSLAPDLSVVVTDATCAGTNGVIDLTVSGGLAPYTYSWSNGMTGEDLTNIPAGDYEVTVTDANSCTSTITETIGDSLAPVLSVEVTDATCAGANGAIDLTMSDGLAPYTFSWSNGMTGEDLTNIPAGDYEVTVTDANACTSTITATVGDSLAPDLSVAITDATCFEANGAIDLTVSGGLAPYIFSWNNGSSNEDLTNIPAGNYEVTVTDANDCTSTLTAIIGDTPAVSAGNDGEISVCNTDLAVVELFDLLDGAETGGIFEAVSPIITGSLDPLTGVFDPVGHLTGDYDFIYIVQGDLPCANDTSWIQLTIKLCACVPPLTPATLSATIVSCKGEVNTTPFVPVSVPGVTYNWYDAPTGGNLLATGTTFTAQTPGTYYAEAVSISDPTCISPGRLAFTLLLDQVGVSVPYVLTTLPGEPINITAIATSTLGTEFTWQWSPAAGLSCTDCPNPWATVSENTTFVVTVVDEYGCSATAMVMIEMIDRLVVIPNAFSPNNDGENDIFRIVGYNVSQVEYHVYDRWGNEMYSNTTSDLLIGWDGTHNGTDCELGVYVYYCIVTYYDGQQQLFDGNVTLIR